MNPNISPERLSQSAVVYGAPIEAVPSSGQHGCWRTHLDDGRLGSSDGGAGLPAVWQQLLDAVIVNVHGVSI